MTFPFSPPLRLRHLHTVLARNLNPKPARHLLSCFFTLSIDDDQESESHSLYRSETLHNTLNPTWAPLETDKRSDRVTVTIWRDNPPRVLLKRRIVFDELAYMGEDATALQSLPLLPPNTILVQLQPGGLYAPTEVVDHICEQHSIRYPQRAIHPPTHMPMRPFTADQVKAFISEASSLRQRLSEVEEKQRKASDDLARGLESHKQLLQQERKREAQNNRLKALQTEADATSLSLEAEKAAFVKERSTLLPRAQKCVDGLTELVRAKQRLKDMRRELRAEVGQLDAIGMAAGRRKQSMLRTLHELFQCGWENPKTYSICGASLPPFDAMGRVAPSGGGNQELDEEAVALGYAAALVSCLGTYLQVPLRFPVKFAGAKTTIYDYISQPTKEAEFPLCSRGELRSRFEYGVDLLNADVEELLASQGIQPEPARPALYSLHRLCTEESGGFNPNRSVLPGAPLPPGSIRASSSSGDDV